MKEAKAEARELLARKGSCRGAGLGRNVRIHDEPRQGGQNSAAPIGIEAHLKKKHQISGIRNHRRTVVDSVLWLAPLCAVVVAGWLAMID
jgi:hypothetical protein